MGTKVIFKETPEEVILYGAQMGWLLLRHLELEETKEDINYIKTTLWFLNKTGEKINLEFNRRAP